MKLHGYIVFYIYVFLQFDTVMEKGLSCKIPIYTDISFSFCQNFMKLYTYCLLKVSPCSLVFLSMQNYVTGKVCSMSFTFGFGFLDSQIERFPVSLRLFKIYVADQKPQTKIAFFPIYTKLCYRKSRLNDKLKHNL